MSSAKTNKELLGNIVEGLEDVFKEFDIDVVEKSSGTVEEKTQSLEDSLMHEADGSTALDSDEVSEIIKDVVSEVKGSGADVGSTIRSKVASRKAHKVIEAALKDKELSADLSPDLDVETMETLAELVDAMDDSELEKLSNALLDEGKESTSEGEEATSEARKTVSKLLDPSKGEVTTRVKTAITKKAKLEYKKGKKEFTMADKLADSVESMDDKTSYGNYNSLEGVEGVQIQSLDRMMGSIKIPKDTEAYLTSPVRREAENFITSTVKEIRKVRAHNVEERTNGLLVGKRIDRKSLHRQDHKIFSRVDVPEEEPAQLSFYVALDFSGSTSGGLDKQIQSVGVALIEAFERLKIKHTIMAYESTVSIVKRGVKRTKDKHIMAADGVHGTGGNNEYAVMKLTQHLINEEHEQDAVLLIITDGDGSGEEEGLKELRAGIPRHKNLEVHSLGLNYDGGSYSLERARGIYGPKNAWTVMNKKDFSKTVGKIVKRSIFKKGNDE